MLDHLPTELRLKTLAYLDVRDLRNIQLTSRSWQEFFLSNGSSIYRHAAALHGFVYSSEMTLREAKLAYPASTVGVQSWKALGTSNTLLFMGELSVDMRSSSAARIQHREKLAGTKPAHNERLLVFRDQCSPNQDRRGSGLDNYNIKCWRCYCDGSLSRLCFMVSASGTSRIHFDYL